MPAPIRALAFVASGVSFIWLGWWVFPNIAFQCLAAWTASTLFCVAGGTYYGLPEITGKQKDGRIHPLFYFLWAPFFLLLQVYVHVYFRRIKYRNFPIITKIHEGWFLGGWPHNKSVLPEELVDQEFLVVDMTCELPKMIETRKENYINVPSWDGTGPTLEEFNSQVTRVVKLVKSSRMPILIHCGFGRGRSLTFLLACLVEAGIHKDWVEAYKHVLSVRRIVHVPTALAPLLVQRGPPDLKFA